VNFVPLLGNLAINEAHAFRKPVILDASAPEQLHFSLDRNLISSNQIFSHQSKDPGQHSWVQIEG
jgi:hypothetical protein